MKCLKEKAKARRAFMLAGALAAIFALAACDMSTNNDDTSVATYTVSTADELMAWNEAAQANPQHKLHSRS